MPYKDPEKQRAAKARSAAKTRAKARAVKAEAVAGLPDPPDRDQLLRILGQLAREGNVSAARTLLEELRRDDGDNEQQARTPLAEFDELASKRSKRAA